MTGSKDRGSSRAPRWQRAAFLVAAIIGFGGAPSLFADTNVATKEPVLVPQTVYVGDRARLIVPLSPSDAASISAPVVVDVTERLPKSKDVVVLRIELQRIEAGARALVDFTAYAPGTVELPRMEAGGIVLSGLTAEIASILEAEGRSAELAPTALTLSAPGTAVLVYGASFAFLLVILAGVFLFIKGPALIREALERRKRGLVARSMRRVATRLAENLAGMESAEFLSILFSELRSYLSYRTGVNYLALTPREFPAAVAGGPRGTPAFKSSYVRLEAVDGSFLEKLFRWGDSVRFGGVKADRSELQTALERVVALVEKIEAELDAASDKAGTVVGGGTSKGAATEGRASQ
jgi:hypothetical protein